MKRFGDLVKGDYVYILMLGPEKWIIHTYKVLKAEWGVSDIKLILNSAILAPVFWSWVMKPICKHFKIDYKQLNLFQ